MTSAAHQCVAKATNLPDTLILIVVGLAAPKRHRNVPLDACNLAWANIGDTFWSHVWRPHEQLSELLVPPNHRATLVEATARAFKFNCQFGQGETVSDYTLVWTPGDRRVEMYHRGQRAYQINAGTGWPFSARDAARTWFSCTPTITHDMPSGDRHLPRCDLHNACVCCGSRRKACDECGSCWECCHEDGFCGCSNEYDRCGFSNEYDDFSVAPKSGCDCGYARCR